MWGTSTYPFSTPSSAHHGNSQLSLATIFPSVRHHRLGHLGKPIFNILRNKNSIRYNERNSSHFCYSCPLEKHVRLPFKSSTTSTFALFDIIHANLCTSPISSKLSHKYYLVLLDDFSHFLWVFPIKYKSQVYDVFLPFRAYVNNSIWKEPYNFSKW